MTNREKQLVTLGIIFGLILAGIVYGVSRYWHMQSASAANTAIVPVQAREDGPTSTPAPQVNDGPLSTVQLTQEEQQQIGLETAVVERRNLQRSLSTVAQVEQPETTLTAISARVGGRIDKLFVNFTGETVRRGQAIAQLYSPELYSSAEEYRLALDSKKRLGSGAERQAVSGADELVSASRRRLELWGLTPQQIEGIAGSTQPQVDLTIYSPASGVVTERKVTQGQYVNAGEPLYTVSDLSTVWVQAQVYQPDLTSIRLGQSADVTSDATEKRIQGRVGFVDPTVNAQTRTATVRVQVANPHMRLRPGMFVQVNFATPRGDVLAIPRSAVVDTGTGKIVYVATGNGNFEGKQVEVGEPADQYYPVLAGLKAGDRVVSQGNFMIDSQTRITGGMTGLYGGSKQFENGQGPAAATPTASVQFRFRADPATPKGESSTTAHVEVVNASGKPVPDAQVRIALVMPAMPAMNMPEMRSPADLTWTGSDYAGKVKVPMAGSWNVEIEARRNGQLLGTYRSRLVAQ